MSNTKTATRNKAKRALQKIGEKDIRFIITTMAPYMIGGGIIYLIYRKITEPSAGIKVIQNSIKQTKLSYPKSQYYNWANKLQIAFAGMWGTDESAIYNIFEQMHTNSDVLMLQMAWGSRSMLLYSGYYYNAKLSELMAGELDTKELAKVNGILAKKGINLTF